MEYWRDELARWREVDLTPFDNHARNLHAEVLMKMERKVEEYEDLIAHLEGVENDT